MKEKESDYMRRAIQVALRGVGQTSPNPAVGAVIVHEDSIISEGYHRKAGAPHAERMAISLAENVGFTSWSEATLYCTLEPCSTVGTTGACSAAIVDKGFKKVVYGSVDPNPSHVGNVDEIFLKENIRVESGVLQAECDAIIRGFRKVQESGLPWVIIKSAMSLDGKVTRPQGEGQWLTNKESRIEVHKLRAEVDAVLTGGNTVRQDDPALTVRLVGRDHELRQPIRGIITRDKENIPESAQLLQDPQTLIYEAVDIEAALRDLAKNHRVNTVLIEAGGGLLGAFCDAGLVDEVVMFLAPMLTGGESNGVSGIGASHLHEALKLDSIEYNQIGNDVMMRGLVITT